MPRFHQSASHTLEQIGLTAVIEQSGRYHAIRPQVRKLDRATQGREIRKLSSSPDVMLGSVHAVTAQGQVLVASGGGSQMGPYASGAGTVIWVVGAQKLVGSLEEGLRRLHEHSYVLEDERMQTACWSWRTAEPDPDHQWLDSAQPLQARHRQGATGVLAGTDGRSEPTARIGRQRGWIDRRCVKSKEKAMSRFTAEEIAYLASQRLGRLATVNGKGDLHVVPVGFRYNPEQDTIDIGGFNMATSKKYREALGHGRDGLRH